MELANLISFITIATLLVISPGPNGVLIAKTTPLFGRKLGFANILGFIAAFYIHGSLSIFGISIILVQSAQAFVVFKLLGAAYLIWIGVKAIVDAWRSHPKHSAQCKTRPIKTYTFQTAFYEGFLTNLLNPKVSMFYLAAFPQFISPSENAMSAYLLVSAHACVNIIWFTGMILLLARVKTATSSPVFIRWLKSTTGAIFIGFGAKLALLRPLNNA